VLLLSLAQSPVINDHLTLVITVIDWLIKQIKMTKFSRSFQVVSSAFAGVQTRKERIASDLG